MSLYLIFPDQIIVMLIAVAITIKIYYAFTVCQHWAKVLYMYRLIFTKQKPVRKFQLMRKLRHRVEKKTAQDHTVQRFWGACVQSPYFSHQALLPSQRISPRTRGCCMVRTPNTVPTLRKFSFHPGWSVVPQVQFSSSSHLWVGPPEF